MQDKIDTIISLAKILRPKLNSLAIYNNDNSNLGGYCAVSSYLLTKEANRIKLYPKLVLGHFDYDGAHSEDKHWCNHAWIQYYGNIIDLTATQFSRYDRKDFKHVHITSVRDKMYRSIHTKKSDVFQCLSTWPKMQNPLSPESFLKNLNNISIDTLQIAC